MAKKVRSLLCNRKSGKLIPSKYLKMRGPEEAPGEAPEPRGEAERFKLSFEAAIKKAVYKK